jgi:hypothetical protein
MPIILTLQCVVEDETIDNLILVIVQSLMQQGGPTQEETTQHFICFGVDGAFFFRVVTLE